MIRKFIPVVFLLIAILIGSVILLAKNNSSQEVTKRDYLIATAEGSNVYKFPLPFQPGTTVGDIARHLSTSYDKIFRRQGSRLISLDPQQQIYTDIQIKIT